MTEQEAIRNMADSANGLFKEIEVQRVAIKQLGEDMDTLVEVFGNIYSHVTPSIRKSKYPTSPYAIFDKYHHKKKRE